MTWKYVMKYVILAGLLFCAPAAVSAAGTATGETSDEKGQQGVDLGSKGQSSNVIMGGPDIIVGQISHIQGDRYSILGDRGQEVSLRVTKDTNIVCATATGNKFSTGQETDREHKEIAPTPFMEKQGGKSSQTDPTRAHEAMTEQIQKDINPNAPGALSKDPTTLLDKVGSTDPKANEDVAKGSGFVVGGKEGCQFKVGDQVRVEASDMGTATTISQLTASGR
jgi:hypothetical protein